MYDSGYGITTDPDTGNIIVTGTFYGLVDFGGGLRADGNSGVTMFVAGYSPSGVYLWDYVRGGNGTIGFGFDKGVAVRINAGQLVLTGQLSSPVLFGSWPNDPTLFGNGYFLASYTLAGNAPPIYRWAKYSGTGAIPNIGNDVAFDRLGHVLTAGSFQATTDFGGITLDVPLSTTAASVAQYMR